jgi:hypothetical protein
MKKLLKNYFKEVFMLGLLVSAVTFVKHEKSVAAEKDSFSVMKTQLKNFNNVRILTKFL